MSRPLAAALLSWLTVALVAGPARAEGDDEDILASPDDEAAPQAGPDEASADAAADLDTRAATLERLTAVLATDGSFKVRTTAAVALGRLGDPAAVAALTDALVGDRHFAVRAAAASALGRLGDTGGVLALLAGLRDADPLVQTQASEALARFHAPRHLLAFREALRSDDARVRRAAVRAYGEVLRAGHEPAALPVVHALGDDDVEIRALAERSINTLGHERALPILLGGLANGTAAVRAGAARMLGARLDERAIPPLLAALSRTGEQEEVREAVREALRRHREYVDFSSLLERARASAPSREEDRLMALRLLGALGDEQALPALRGALKDTSPLVRTTAARAAADLGGDSARTLLKDALKTEREPRVRQHLGLLLRTSH